MAGLGKTDGIMWHSEHDTTVAKGKKVKKNKYVAVKTFSPNLIKVMMRGGGGKCRGRGLALTEWPPTRFPHSFNPYQFKTYFEKNYFSLTYRVSELEPYGDGSCHFGLAPVPAPASASILAS